MRRNSEKPGQTHRRTRTEIDPLVRSYIGEAARGDRKANWRELQDRVKQRFRVEELDYPVPRTRAIQQIAKEERTKKGVTLDDPWSLAYNSPLLPPDASGDLLAVWKESVKLGRTFSVREARWVARLRSALPSGEPSHLYQVAVAYARHERSYEGKEPKPTPDLDAELAFRLKGDYHLREWEYSQAVMTGTVPLSEGRVIPRYIDDIPPGSLKSHSLPSGLPWPSEFFASEVARIARELNVLSAAEGKLSWWPQARSVSIFWLRRIAKGVKKWQGINLGYGGSGVPGDKEIAEWKDMAAKLVSLVVQRAQLLDAWQKYYAAGGTAEELLAALKKKELPQTFKESGLTGDWHIRKRVEEFLSEDRHFAFLKRFLASLGLDELGNPVKSSETSEKGGTP